MRRSFIVIIVIVAVALVSGAGYMGYQSNRPTGTPAIVAPDTVAVTTCDVEQTVTAPGNLVNTQEYTVDMPIDGRLAEMLVRPGDRVEAGQVLARLGDREKYTSAVAAARLELLQAQHERDQLLENAPVDAAQARLAVVAAQKALDDLLNPSETAIAEARIAVMEAQEAANKAQGYVDGLKYPRASRETIATAQATYLVAKYEVQRLQQEYRKIKGDPTRNAAKANALARLEAARTLANRALATLNWLQSERTQEEIDEKNADLALAQGQLADAQAALEKLTNPSTEDIALAQAQLEQAEKEWERLEDGLDALTVDLAEVAIENAQATLDEAEAALEQIEITTPFAGVILEVSARQGETLPAGTGLMVLNDPQSVEVEASVIEEDLPYVDVGQPVDLFFDALPDEEIHGTIARILPKRLAGDRPLYSIFITLDHVPDKLIAGMTADSSIIIAMRAGALCLPRALVGASPDGTAIVEVWTGERKEQRPVQVGLRGDIYVEILSGLSEGELVLAK